MATYRLQLSIKS